VNRGWILHAWQVCHGELTREQQLRFLRDPVLDRIDRFPVSEIRRAIARSARLVEVAEFLESNRLTSELSPHVAEQMGFKVYSLGPWHSPRNSPVFQMGTVVHELKYGGLNESQVNSTLQQLTDVMMPVLKKIWPVDPAQFLVPVPSNLPNSRNIPLRLSQTIAKSAGCQHRPDLLRKTRRVRSMKNTPPGQRPAVLEGAYEAFKPKPSGGRILVIDDVFETGSTLGSVNDAFLAARLGGTIRFLVLAHLDRPGTKWRMIK